MLCLPLWIQILSNTFWSGSWGSSFILFFAPCGKWTVKNLVESRSVESVEVKNIVNLLLHLPQCLLDSQNYTQSSSLTKYVFLTPPCHILKKWVKQQEAADHVREHSYPLLSKPHMNWLAKIHHVGWSNCFLWNLCTTKVSQKRKCHWRFALACFKAVEGLVMSVNTTFDVLCLHLIRTGLLHYEVTNLGGPRESVFLVPPGSCFTQHFTNWNEMRNVGAEFCKWEFINQHFWHHMIYLRLEALL